MITKHLDSIDRKETWENPDSIRTHDGLLVRFKIGTGFMGVEDGAGYSSSSDSSLKYYPTYHLSIELGYSIHENVALQVVLQSDWPIFFSGGGGITIFLPKEFWTSIAMSGGFGGYFGTLQIGHEWWVANQWGLGVYVSQNIGTLTYYDDLNIKTQLGFSLTYN